jgi:hypothetical protein
MNLAKYPASTVQILGAEKALFRSLKTRQATPKYGILYHASLVGHATAKNKGKVCLFYIVAKYIFKKKEKEKRQIKHGIIFILITQYRGLLYL